MCAVEATFQVEHVEAGPLGGAVFFGKCADGFDFSAKVDMKWLYRIPQIGETWRVKGERKPHSKYPDTIHCKSATPVVPSETGLLRRFLLEHPEFRGFGFGKKKMDQLKANGLEGPSLLKALNDKDLLLLSSILTTNVAESLLGAWHRVSAETGTLNFLEKYGFDRGLANTIIKIYGNNAEERLRDNPYRLIAFGFGRRSLWKAADESAAKLGFGKNDKKRLAAAVEQAIYDRLEEGHTSTELPALRERIKTLLGSSSNKLADDAIRAAAGKNAIVQLGSSNIQGIGPAAMEAYIEKDLVELVRRDHSQSQTSLFSKDFEQLRKLVARYDDTFYSEKESRLKPSQKEAIEVATTSNLSIITGGAGTGKTTIMKGVHSVATALGQTVYQMALSGRAKEHLRKTTGRPAHTIHAFIHKINLGLESPDDPKAITLEPNPLIIIDEASMVDLALFHRLLRSLPKHYRLLMVGDPAQLPPIGFGLVFHRLCTSKAIRRVNLDVVVRGGLTEIPLVAQKVRNKEMQTLPDYVGPADGVFFLDCEEDLVVKELFRVSKELKHDCQILSARKRKGKDSTNRINSYFQFGHNDAQKQMELVRWKMYVNDPVIVTRNNQELELYNGTLGVLKHLDGRKPVFEFDGKEYSMTDDEISESGIELAYGITVHKSQGSEFDRIIIPVFDYGHLDRSLIYTAITRARVQVVLIGNRSHFDSAVKRSPRADMLNVGFCLDSALAA
ncbi:MAG: AAA family ATPase [Pedobacter sp.]